MKRIAFLLLFIAAAFAGAAEPESALLSRLHATAKKSQRMQLYQELVTLYRGERSLDKAIFTCTQALDEGPAKRTRYDLLVTRGELHLQSGRYERAIESLQEAVGLLPKEEKARLLLASTYVQSELNELARQEYFDILKRDKRSFEAQMGLAALYLKEGLNTQAMEYYRRALTIRPAPEVYRQISRCAENAGDIHLASAMLRHLIPEERTYEDYIHLGNLYREEKKPKDAEEAYSQAVKLNQEEADAYLYLGLLYMENGALRPAEQLLQIVREKAPDEGVVHFFLGSIYYRSGDRQRAAGEIEQAKKLATTDLLRGYCDRLLSRLSRGQ